MQHQSNNQRKTFVITGLLACAGAGFGTGCTPEQASAVLAGVQVAADELNSSNNEEVSFGDWLSSELDD